MANENKDSEFVLVKVKTSSRDLANSLSKKVKRHQYVFIDEALKFFEVTKIDPRDYQLSPAQEIKALKDTVIGFYRKHEKEKTDPMLNKVEALVNTLVTFIGQVSNTLNSNPNFQTNPISVSTDIVTDIKLNTGVVSKRGFKVPDIPISDSKLRIPEIPITSSPIPDNTNMESFLSLTIALEKKEIEMKRLLEKMDFMKSKFKLSSWKKLYDASISEQEFTDIFS